MRFYHRLIRTLVVPSNAGPNDPAFVLGPDIPQLLRDLIHERLSVNNTVIMAAFWRRDSTAQQFECLSVDTSGSSDYSIVRGMLVSTTANSTVSQIWRYNTTTPNFDQVYLAANFDGGSGHGYPYHFVEDLRGWRIDLAAAGNPVNPIIRAGGSLTSPAGGATHTAIQINDVAGTASQEIGRGVRYFNASTGADVAIGTTYTTLFTTTFTFRAGRAYRCEWGASVTCSLSTNVMEIDMHINSVQIAAGAVGPSGAAFAIAARGSQVVANTTGGDLARTTSLDAIMSSGTGAVKGTPSGVSQYFFRIEDCGAAVDHPGCIAVT